MTTEVYHFIMESSPGRFDVFIKTKVGDEWKHQYVDTRSSLTEAEQLIDRLKNG